VVTGIVLEVTLTLFARGLGVIWTVKFVFFFFSCIAILIQIILPWFIHVIGESTKYLQRI
jgi:hypothetical protein